MLIFVKILTLNLMKKLYTLLFLVYGFITNAQIVNIPDANFKAKLLSASASNGVASTETPLYNSSNGSWSVSSFHNPSFFYLVHKKDSLLLYMQCHRFI